MRLGLVQSAIGAIAMLATSLLNRIMVVEYALPAALPAGLVAWHYAVQLSRPMWGHWSDRGRRRTTWIIAGMAMLAAGAMLAVAALSLLAERTVAGYALAVLAYSMIGAGVGAAGTSLLALLATMVAPTRRAAAASVTWIMMVAGIVVSAGVAGAFIDPFSLHRLAIVAGCVAGTALLVTIAALFGIERLKPQPIVAREAAPTQDFRASLRTMLADREAYEFTIFIFVSMLAYSMQDLILEPFSGLIFGFSPGQSTQLSSVQHGGVLIGMVLVGVGAGAFGKARGNINSWIVGGCLGSALALAGLAMAANIGRGWPLSLNIAALGFANGIFAVAAIGKMMALAKSADGGSEGIRMGVWGASQAIAFGIGGLIGAVGLDIGRALSGSVTGTFAGIFAVEALLFGAAGWLAARDEFRQPALRTGPEVA